MRAEMDKEIGAMKKSAKGRAVADSEQGMNGGMLPSPTAFDENDGDDGSGDGYGAFEQERQMEIMQDQDQALDGVFKTVGNLRQQADSMGRELEEQGEILDEVEMVTDRVEGKLQTGLKKVGWVLKKNEGEDGVYRCYYMPKRMLIRYLDTMSTCCIGILIFVLILLLILIIIL